MHATWAAGDSFLLTDIETSHTVVELLRDREVDRLTCVLCAGEEEPIQDAWRRHGGDSSRIEFVNYVEIADGVGLSEEDVGASVPCTSHPEHGLEGVPEKIGKSTELLEDGSHVVLLHDCQRIIESAGIGRTLHVLEQLMSRVDTGDVRVGGSLQPDTPPAVVAGLSQWFDHVFEPIEHASVRTFQPRGRVGGYAASTIFELLTPARRRRLLRALDETNGWSDLDELAARLARDSLDESLSGNPDRVKTTLYQVDLPKCCDVGIIDFDRDSHRARILPSAIQCWPYLRLTAETHGV